MSHGLVHSVLVVLVALAASARAGEPVHGYVGVKKCAMCHGKDLYGNQVEVLRAGPHARAFESLNTPQALEDARKAGIHGKPSEHAACVECHVTAHDAPAKMIKYELARADGVQCESCHGAGNDYRKKSIMSERERAIAKGLVADPEKVCEDCHNSRSPHWNPARYARADGSSVGFDYEQAIQKIAHPIPKDRRHKIVEMEKDKDGDKGGGSDE